MGLWSDCTCSRIERGTREQAQGIIIIIIIIISIMHVASQNKFVSR
jgi:hypothetical protein